jgi:hypothetical protein
VSSFFKDGVRLFDGKNNWNQVTIDGEQTSPRG